MDAARQALAAHFGSKKHAGAITVTIKGRASGSPATRNTMRSSRHFGIGRAWRGLAHDKIKPMKIGPSRKITWYDETPASAIRKYGIQRPILILGNDKDMHCTDIKPEDNQEALEWDYIDNVVFAGQVASPEKKRDVWRGLFRQVYDRRKKRR